MAATLLQHRPTLPSAANDAAPAPSRSLLRFITCGSVDDGKSTLIGRLLADAGAVPDDVMAGIEADSARLGKAGGGLDYALLVDGLAAEREQGITIDVAYRYFATARRSFIVADTPGHEQYTRNMATGASGADLAVILVDAEKGLLPQTRRHSFIVSLVGVRHVIVAVNKMDRVDWSEAKFRAIEADYRAAVAGLGFSSVTAIPLSARDGDNVARPSPRAPWHRGPTLVQALETADTDEVQAMSGIVLPVQGVNRPDSSFRGFSGTVAAGVLRPGAAVTALPSGTSARIARIVTFDGDLEEAEPGRAVTVTLDAAIDVSRGDVMVGTHSVHAVRVAREIDVRLLVTAPRTIAAGDAFEIRLGTASANATVVEVKERIDVATFAALPGGPLALNAIGAARLRLDRPLAVAAYGALRDLGSLILIDRLTNETAALGVVHEPAPTPIPRGPASVTALRGWLEKDRRALWPALTWRAASAGLLALVVYAVTGHGPAAIVAGLADAAGRVALRRVHGAAWRRLNDEPAGGRGR